MSASVKVILFKSKTLKNGEHPIMLRAIKDRKSKYISVGASCDPKLWDAKNNCPKKSHPAYVEIRVLIEVKQAEAQKMLLGMNTDSQDFSAEEIQRKLKNTVSRKVGVLEYFQEVIADLARKNRIGYANTFRSTMNSVTRFRKGMEITFSDINGNFLNRYEEFCTSGGAQLNTVFVYMRTFKTLLNYAKKAELVRSDYDPFKTYPFTKYRRIETRKRALSFDDLQKVIDLETEPGTPMHHAKNYFLFSYYCRGINFSDIAFLKWPNIEGERMNYVRKKTGEAFNMKLVAPAQAIIEYYKQEFFQTRDGFVFPILFDRHKTATSIDNRIDKMLKIVNKALKEIGAKCDISTPLTTYVARHSFATNMKRSGVPVSVISEALGHDSEKTTKIYLDSFENDALDSAVEMLVAKHRALKD